jgi:hypothetical protein
MPMATETADKPSFEAARGWRLQPQTIRCVPSLLLSDSGLLFSGTGQEFKCDSLRKGNIYLL